jgi:hypothetical protein
MQQFLQSNMLDILSVVLGSSAAVIWFCVEQKLIDGKKDKSIIQLIREL